MQLSPQAFTERELAWLRDERTQAIIADDRERYLELEPAPDTTRKANGGRA